MKSEIKLKRRQSLQAFEYLSTVAYKLADIHRMTRCIFSNSQKNKIFNASTRCHDNVILPIPLRSKIVNFILL